MIFSIRTYQPLSQIGLLIVAFIWLICKSFMTTPPTEIIPIYEPLSRIYFSYAPQDAFVNLVISILLLSFQAVYLSILMQKHNLVERNNWIPSILYLVLSIITMNGILTNIVISNLFILLMFGRLFDSFQSIKGVDNVMLSSFYVTISSLFYYPSIILILAIFICLIIFRHINWRHFVSILLGMFIPILYLATFYFLTDELFVQYNLITQMWSEIFAHLHEIVLDRIILTLIISFFLFLSIFHLSLHQQGKLIKIRKKTSVLITFSIFSIIMLLISTQPTAQSLLNIILLLSATFSIYLIEVKKQLVSTILFWSIVLTTILSTVDII